jgi:hypothetical protein
MFKNRKILIASKHKKELVIGPILQEELGLLYFTDETYDTDYLGTFTGEVERKLDPISAARKKCLEGIALNDCEIGIASEGSFGPHPQTPFLTCNEEILIFIDTKNNLEIIARELSLETNFNAATLTNEEELLRFAELVKFPSHGLILRKSPHENEDIFKGIQDKGELVNTFQYLLAKHQKVHAETDMRAMFNPTRLQVIKNATHKLVQKINEKCPVCDFPGFSIKKTKKGLKCNLCGSPTNSLLSVILVCESCSFEKEDLYPNQKTTEDPMYCDHCNP